MNFFSLFFSFEVIHLGNSRISSLLIHRVFDRIFAKLAMFSSVAILETYLFTKYSQPTAHQQFMQLFC